MKKILALILVLCLFGCLAACAEVTRISVENPAKLMIEKEGGSIAITLTDEKTVGRITDVICQVPLQTAEATEDTWTYRLVWQDAEGREISRVDIAGTLIRWNGENYKVSVGVDLSVVTDVLETIPGLNKSE